MRTRRSWTQSWWLTIWLLISLFSSDLLHYLLSPIVAGWKGNKQTNYSKKMLLPFPFVTVSKKWKMSQFTFDLFEGDEGMPTCNQLYVMYNYGQETQDMTWACPMHAQCEFCQPSWHHFHKRNCRVPRTQWMNELREHLADNISGCWKRFIAHFYFLFRYPEHLLCESSSQAARFLKKQLEMLVLQPITPALIDE